MHEKAVTGGGTRCQEPGKTRRVAARGSGHPRRTGKEIRGRIGSDRRTRLPVRPVHVPAVEAVGRVDRLVTGVPDVDDVTDDRGVVEPGALALRVVGALGVVQADTAVADVGAAEGPVGAPV